MRSFLSTGLALALLTSTAMAADIGSLPAGKPAGFKQAQVEGNTLLIVGLGAAAIAGIAIAASDNGNNATVKSTTVTSSTGTTA